MKRPGVDGGLLICFAINLVLNAVWALPGIILIIVHFIAGSQFVPLSWGLIALGVWVAVVFAITLGLSTLLSLSHGANRNREPATHYSSQIHAQAQSARTVEQAFRKAEANENVSAAPEARGDELSYDAKRDTNSMVHRDRLF